MKEDLDRLMEEKNIDAIWVSGPAQHNAAMVYFTGVSHLTHAEFIKKKGESPVLFHNPMEREEAARTGFQTVNLATYEFKKLLEEAGGDYLQARARMYEEMLTEVDLLQGSIVLYGKVNLGGAWGVFSVLQDLLPELDFIGEGPNSILLEARATKGEGEVEEMRKMGQVTTEVVQRVEDYLTSSQVNEDEELITADGELLCVKDVKSKINLWLAELGAENPEGAIFAIGRDAGIPHSTGTDADVLRLGQTIVFDIFPCQKGGGYFYDFTRTWCLGYAPEEERALYEDVLRVYQKILSELSVDGFAPDLQERTCELFEELGHKTIRQDSQLQDGYVHSLGHGLGLNVHERPRFSRGATEADRLAPGTITTIEPGLYYPGRNMGCRLENTVWVRPDGEMEVLVDYPLNLVLDMEHWDPR